MWVAASFGFYTLFYLCLFGVFLSSFFFRIGVTLFIPSICSNSRGSTLALIGSSMKSMPSLLASFAAGTKSESPENKTIVSTKRFNASDAMSTPIFISIPFCFMSKYTSLSTKSSKDVFLSSKSLTTLGLISHFPLSFSVPIRKATFLFRFNALNKSILSLYSSVCLKSTQRLLIGLWCFLSNG